MIPLTDDEIHIWIARDQEITDPDLLASYLQLLNPEESAQQQRFHFPEHRHQYLVTRALVRTVLSMYVETIEPRDWRFCQNSFNKPFISNAPLPHPLFFNLSHAEQMIVLAIGTAENIGVDVEYLARENAFLDLAEHYFSDNEVADLLRLPPSIQKQRFYDLWTLKEAYIKACGMGLSIPLDQFSYRFPERGRIAISFAPERRDDPDQWRFWQLQPGPAHVVGLAVQQQSIDRSFDLSIREIVPLDRVRAAEPAIKAQSATIFRPVGAA